MVQTILHVGMMKAGSTTLQANIFERHTGIHNIWKPQKEAHAILKQMMDLENNELPRQELHDYINARRQEAKERSQTMMASCERFTTSPLMSFSAQRGKEFFPDAKILMIVREQKAFIRSYYLFRSQKVGHLLNGAEIPARYSDQPIPFEDYLNFHVPEDGDEVRHKTQWYVQIAWRLKFAKLMELYEELWGQENCCVLPIEMSEKNPQEFSRRLSHFLDVDEAEMLSLVQGPRQNKGPPETALAYARWRRLLPTGIPFSKIIPFGSKIRDFAIEMSGKHGAPAVSFSNEMLERIERLYAEDNANLEKRYDLDLSQYGYVVPKSVRKTAVAA